MDHIPGLHIPKYPYNNINNSKNNNNSMNNNNNDNSMDSNEISDSLFKTGWVSVDEQWNNNKKINNYNNIIVVRDCVNIQLEKKRKEMIEWLTGIPTQGDFSRQKISEIIETKNNG